MINRIPYDELNKRAVDGFDALAKHVTAIDKKIQALVELRVSQINGSVYCLDSHARQARAFAEAQQRLDCLAAWRASPFFTARERAAVEWAEAVTLIAQTHAPDTVYGQLCEHFSDREIVDLTLIITFMNSWNRLAIGFRQLPEQIAG